MVGRTTVRLEAGGRRRGLAVLSLIVLLGTACDWRSDGAARLREKYPEPDLTEGPADVGVEDIDRTPYEVVPSGDLLAEELVGSWVVEMKLPATMELFAGFDPYPLLLTNLFIATWTEEGLVWTYCHQIAKLDAGGLGETEMLPNTDAAIGSVPIEIATADGVGIAEQQVAWTWGITGMKNPLKDPLPTSADDPLVWDQDKDEKPGVTIKVLQPEGFRYMVRRAVWKIHPPAVLADGQRLEGTLDFTVDEGAVGYEGPSSLKTIVPIVPDPGGGAYVMVRTESAYSCADLLAEYPGIF